jgi:hypothetical protein
MGDSVALERTRRRAFPASGEALQAGGRSWVKRSCARRWIPSKRSRDAEPFESVPVGSPRTPGNGGGGIREPRGPTGERASSEGSMAVPDGGRPRLPRDAGRVPQAPRFRVSSPVDPGEAYPRRIGQKHLHRSRSTVTPALAAVLRFRTGPGPTPAGAGHLVRLGRLKEGGSSAHEPATSLTPSIGDILEYVAPQELPS